MSAPSRSVSAYDRLSLLALCASALAALAGATMRVDPALRYFHSDKLEHISVFAFITICASAGGRAWVRIGLVAALAGFVEIAQIFVPARTASWWDLCASLTGVALGAIAGLMAREMLDGRRGQ